jgi:hypothetical protein
MLRVRECTEGAHCNGGASGHPRTVPNVTEALIDRTSPCRVGIGCRATARTESLIAIRAPGRPRAATSHGHDRGRPWRHGLQGPGQAPNQEPAEAWLDDSAATGRVASLGIRLACTGKGVLRAPGRGVQAVPRAGEQSILSVESGGPDGLGTRDTGLVEVGPVSELPCQGYGRVGVGVSTRTAQGYGRPTRR